MTEKKNILVRTLEELTVVVDRLIATGRTDAKIHFGATLLLEPEAWVQLERLTTDHPSSQPKENSDGEARSSPSETPEAEVVSYSADALGEQEHRGFHYKVTPSGAGFKAHVHQGCAGWFEPFDIDFPTIGDAHEHAVGYIDGVIEQAEREAAKIKAASVATSDSDHDTYST